MTATPFSAARFDRGHVRAFCVGVAITGWTYFLFFASPTYARGASQPYRQIAQPVVTIPLAAARSSAASLCYRCFSKSMRGEVAMRPEIIAGTPNECEG